MDAEYGGHNRGILCIISTGVPGGDYAVRIVVILITPFFRACINELFSERDIAHEYYGQPDVGPLY